MATTLTLQMQFLTDQNRKVRITVQNPKMPVDQAAVESAMDLIVAKNIFEFPQGIIVKKIGATTVQTDSNAVG